MKLVDAYIDGLPEQQSILASKIRELLFEIVPGIEERFSFKIPFYHYFGMFCYINSNKNGINLAFCRGKDLQAAFPQLQLNGRAIIATITLKDNKDFSRFEVRQLIEAAAAWNEEAKRLKVPMVKSTKKKSSKKK